MRALARSAAALVTTLAATTLAGPAEAAPQPLGLVAHDSAIPMICEGETCTAVVSAFCLTEQRKPPQHNERYRLAEGSEVTVEVRDEAGLTRQLDAAQLAQFRAHQGYSTVRISIPRERLDAAAKQVSIRISPLATLLPKSVAGDPNPLTDAEIALAVGPLRKAAQAVFESDSPDAGAARLAGLLVNRLPEGGVADGQVAHILREVRRSADPQRKMSGAFRRNEGLLAGCLRLTESTVGATVRRCMAVRHQDLMRALNKRYWDSVGGV